MRPPSPAPTISTVGLSEVGAGVDMAVLVRLLTEKEVVSRLLVE